MAKKKKKNKNPKKVYVKRGVLVNRVVKKKKGTTNRNSGYGKNGQMGCWGGIIFKISETNLLPMQNMKQDLSGRWAKHDVIGSKPKSEFQGADLRTFTLSTIVDVQFGLKPHTMMKKINQACENGKVDILVIGTHKIGTRKWKLEKVSESYDLIYRQGELARATIDLTFSEY